MHPWRRTVAIAVLCSAVAASCASDTPGSAEPDPTTPSTSSAAPIDAGAQPCGATLPVFFAGDDQVAEGGIDGLPGPGDGSVAVEPTQLVAHWQADFDITFEVRWPGTPVPPDTTTMEVPSNAYVMNLWPENPTGSTERVFVTVRLDGDSSDPCSVLSVEAYAPRVDPIFDHLFFFAGSLRPIAERAEFVAVRENAVTRAEPDDLPDGRCATPIPARVDGDGEIDLETQRLVLEAFLADRLARNAAEPCLANPAVASYHEGVAEFGLPALCLTTCAEVELVDGRLQERSYGSTDLLVDYRRLDGTLLHLRESFEFGVDHAGDVLILSAGIGPDSHVDEARARRLISDFLDATAAGEYAIASRYLFNEGTPQEVVDRIGEYGGDTPFEERFAEFCRTAACDAPSVVGDTLEPHEYQRIMSVEFETTAGAVVIPIGVGMFEGIGNVMNLPPEGTGTGRATIDERVFGVAYEGDLTIVRQRAVQRFGDGNPIWIADYRLRGIRFFDLAGDHILSRGFGDAQGAVRTFVPGDNDGDGMEPEVILRADGATESYPAGGSTVAGRPVAFIAGNDKIFVAVDLDRGEHVHVFPADKVWGDAAPEGADATDGRIVVTVVVGDSSWLEVYGFDAGTLTAADLISRIQPDGYLGYGHISPDGKTVVATLEADSYVPVTTVAVFDAATGDLRDRFVIDTGAQVVELDYDGRWIVARLDDERLWVIDTAFGTSRRVDSPVHVRFG